MRRLLTSNILITSTNGICTELAKNLILCGANLTIMDDKLVDEDDVETNFLIGLGDLGQSRAQLIHDRLHDMNPLAKIMLNTKFNLEEF